MMLFSRLAEKEKYGEPFALVTIISSSGTVSRRSGRMAVFPDGTTEGTVGGGKHEAEAVKEALECIREGRGRRVRLPVREYGEIEVMIDVPIRERRIVILGAGHVGRALYEEFRFLSWNVTVVDTREDLLTPENFPSAVRIPALSLRKGLEEAFINGNTAVVCTIPEEKDNIRDILEACDAFYIGFLSSRKRRPLKDRRCHMPMGIEIGEETPEEIALSTASEILSSLTRKSCMPYSGKRRRPVVVRGAGDLATGVITALFRAGYSVIATETEKPTVIRRTVSFAEGVWSGEMTIEGVKGILCKDSSGCLDAVRKGLVALIVDERGDIIRELGPEVVVDAIIAKRNLGTKITDAPFVVALGPGFTCGIDANCVIETMRGHTLGKILYEGSAIANTGIPGIIGGKGKERVMHTPCAGVFRENARIGDIVKQGDIIGYVDETPLPASIDGKLRGLLHSGISVPAHFKAADIDPRGESVDHMTISDKARAIGSSTVVAIDNYMASLD